MNTKKCNAFLVPQKKPIFLGKKGITWEQILLAVIALTVVFLVIFWFRRSGEQIFTGTEQQIQRIQAGDSDGDGVADFLDKCPCDAQFGRTLEAGKRCTVECPATT